MLRDYQQRSIDALYKWFSDGGEGNPCLVLPTGSGKSHIVAALCSDALRQWPETRILMLTHVKELIEQNAEKMRQHWPGAPLGIYSASVGRRDLGEPITFAGIQSVRNRAKQLGHIDLVIIDECHMVNHNDQGGYRKLIGDLMMINPALRVVGLTATPYRLGHGLITDKPALFDDLLEPVTIEELVHRGFLAPLRSKVTKTKLDTTGVQKRGGDFIESQLQLVVNTVELTTSVVDEVIALAGDRKAWLFFCAGVDHAHHVRDVLISRGISAACVTGDTPKKERERILVDYKSSKLRALTNANVLTTGFDYPDIDLVAMLRPTMSPGLYVQMAGRGMRLKSHTDHCLVLDFAGVVETHGPITAVIKPKKPGEGGGEAPSKTCESCGEIVHVSVRECPCCNELFPEKPKVLKLRDVDIMGARPMEMEVTGWQWRPHTSRTSGMEMLKVTYYGDLSDKPVTEYFPVLHDGYAGSKARHAVALMAIQGGVRDVVRYEDMNEAIKVMSNSKPPAIIQYRLDGKFFRVMNRQWKQSDHQNPSF